MKTRTYATIVAVIAFAPFSSGGSPARAQGTPMPMQHDMAKMDMSSMMKEPHHVLAMAYMESIGTFAKALNTQAGASGPLDVKSARIAVGEISRSFDLMDEQREAHMKAMNMGDMKDMKDMKGMGGMKGMHDPMPAQMASMMKDMDAHLAMLGTAISTLEKDVKAGQPDAKQIAAHTADILKHLADMAKMHDSK